MSQSIVQLVNGLPEDNLTVSVLKALDFVVPGEWENLVGFEHTISAITGETDMNEIRKIRERVIEIYEDGKEGYKTAVWIYQTLDKTDRAIGAGAIADKIGDMFSFIPVLDKITPKADNLQTVDLSLKLVGELIAYSKMNQISLNPQNFAASLQENYRYEALMRMAALVAIDGLIPLGPDFLSKVQNTLSGSSTRGLERNPNFSAISRLIPGADKQGFINQTFGAVQGWMEDLISSIGLTPETLFAHLSNLIEFSDDKLDYVAAFLDASTNYYEHTGIQTVARNLITRAVSS
ncbi:MAG: hypothetical protein DSM107014_13210 [Gomphosphaeria aponina SAG 52.96 = DSM 107014]|uniref:Uncharacterized protein n=1 Tax=Gomphosphaeria aponina SAG 52.96 = DSM 107014 TaxID=1521640 RepID=A0A941JQC5_9CHRO|nr:hypothetical protein [Gomphosphaeria aponina SAG 52.96 = DSM 107014]